VKPAWSARENSSSAASAASRREAKSAAVAPRGEAPWSGGEGSAERGSRSSASRVASSGAARKVARNAAASRLVRAWRRRISTSFICSVFPKADKASAEERLRVP
jgi:hypothetical protein